MLCKNHKFLSLSAAFLLKIPFSSKVLCYKTSIPFMLKYRYCICGVYFSMGGYLLGEGEYFQEIQLPLENWLQR